MDIKVAILNCACISRKLKSSKRIARLESKCWPKHLGPIARMAHTTNLYTAHPWQRTKTGNKLGRFYPGVIDLKINMLCARPMAAFAVDTVYQRVFIQLLSSI